MFVIYNIISSTYELNVQQLLISVSQVCLRYYAAEFMELSCACPAVVCCRCSPTQKAQVVELIKKHTGKRTAAIGDGGNDVSMIQV